MPYDVLRTQLEQAKLQTQIDLQKSNIIAYMVLEAAGALNILQVHEALNCIFKQGVEKFIRIDFPGNQKLPDHSTVEFRFTNVLYNPNSFFRDTNLYKSIALPIIDKFSAAIIDCHYFKTNVNNIACIILPNNNIEEVTAIPA